MPSFNKSSGGFTLVELLIVVAISAMLSALAITYSSIGRNEVALSIDESKISQFIVQAKGLAIATYTSGVGTCGYGVAIDPASQTYSIFAYHPNGAPPCPPVSSISSIATGTEEQPYTSGTWRVPVSTGVRLQGPNDFVILFYPPDPTVLLSNDGVTLEQASLAINLTTVDGENHGTILVNSQGQVSF